MHSEGPQKEKEAVGATEIAPAVESRVKEEPSETAPEEYIQAAENEVQQLKQEGEAGVAQIEQNISLPPEEVAAVKEQGGFYSRLQSIQTESVAAARLLAERIRTIVVGKPAEGPVYASEEEKKAAEERAEELEMDLQIEKELSPAYIKEALDKRNALFEGRGLFKLSKNDFNDHFATFAGEDFEIRPDLKQGNVGDCYAVAALHALTTSPHFEMIIRSSVERLPDGSWNVTVPFLSENGIPIHISQEEIAPQWNKEFLKIKKGELPDIRPRLHPLAGKEGLQVLEATYIKQKFGEVDRLKAEGGYASDVFNVFGGENFARRELDSAVYDHTEKRWTYPGLDTLTPEHQVFLNDFLENYDPEIYIAAASTKHFDNSSIPEFLANQLGVYPGTGTQKFFVSGHAYSISKVEPKEKKIILANPWDTARPIELTFDQFKSTFRKLDAVRINSATLIRNMSRQEQKAA